MQVGPYLNVETVGNSYAPEVSQWYDSITGHYYKSDSVNGTSLEDSMGDHTINFKVPDGHIATINVTLTVDDWGCFDLFSMDDPETMILHLGMMENVDASPGPRGGHTIWSKSGLVQLLPGDYRMVIYHKNATYVTEYAHAVGTNVAQCDFSIRATKVAATCEILWPLYPVTLGTPITWYVKRQDGNAVQYKHSTGTISEISAEEFAAMARVIYAEAGTEGEEMKAIASVMLNRLGNSSGGNSYRNPVLSMLDEFNQRDANGKNPNWASVTDKQYASVEGDKCYNIDAQSCTKLKAAVSALYEEIVSGPTYPYDGFRTAGTTSQSHVRIGGTDFLTERQYAICDVKPTDWDSIGIWPGSPLDT